MILEFPHEFMVRWPSRFTVSTGEKAEFGAHIQLVRYRLGLSQQALADELEVARETVWEWENGLHRPRGDVAEAVYRLIEETLDEDDLSAIRVRDLRMRLGLTQRELAERIGVHPNTVSKWERGKRKPSEEMVERIEELRRGGPLENFPAWVRARSDTVLSAGGSEESGGRARRW